MNIDKKAMEIAKAIDTMSVDEACEVITSTLTTVAEEAIRDVLEEVRAGVKKKQSTGKVPKEIIDEEDGYNRACDDFLTHLDSLTK